MIGEGKGEGEGYDDRGSSYVFHRSRGDATSLSMNSEACMCMHTYSAYL